jgi:hypothetical protein
MTKKWIALLATVGASLVVCVPGAISAHHEESANVKTTVTIGSVGYQGKVSAASASCVGERTVVLKQKGNGVLSRVKSKANGNWKADLEELNENIKIPAKVYAEVKASYPAGPVATCLAAVSKTVEIAGG